MNRDEIERDVLAELGELRDTLQLNTDRMMELIRGAVHTAIDRVLRRHGF
jgi:hypothetical protein